MNSPDNPQLEQAPRDDAGRLRPGARLNPHGRPAGSGGGFRAVARMILDIADRNQDRIRQALREEAEKNPARFARTFLLPIVPAKERKAFRERIRQMEAHALKP